MQRSSNRGGCRPFLGTRLPSRPSPLPRDGPPCGIESELGARREHSSVLHVIPAKDAPLYAAVLVQHYGLIKNASFAGNPVYSCVLRQEKLLQASVRIEGRLDSLRPAASSAHTALHLDVFRKRADRDHAVLVLEDPGICRDLQAPEVKLLGRGESDGHAARKDMDPSFPAGAPSDDRVGLELPDDEAVVLDPHSAERHALLGHIELPLEAATERQSCRLKREQAEPIGLGRPHFHPAKRTLQPGRGN